MNESINDQQKSQSNYHQSVKVSNKTISKHKAMLPKSHRLLFGLILVRMYSKPIKPAGDRSAVHEDQGMGTKWQPSLTNDTLGLCERSLPSWRSWFAPSRAEAAVLPPLEQELQQVQLQLWSHAHDGHAHHLLTMTPSCLHLASSQASFQASSYLASSCLPACVAS